MVSIPSQKLHHTFHQHHPIQFPYPFPHPHHATPSLPPDPVMVLLSPKMTVNEDAIKIAVDVLAFSPEEISVRTEDQVLFVEGGPAWQSGTERRFMEKFRLPKNCNTDAMECKIASEGVLTITIPREMTSRRRLRSSDGVKKHRVDGHLEYQRLFPQTWVHGVDCTDHKFVVRLHIPRFNSSEINVDIRDDFLVVGGFHKDKFAEGLVSCGFRHRYLLPSDSEKEELQSELDSRGELVITVPRICSMKALSTTPE